MHVVQCSSHCKLEEASQPQGVCGWALESLEIGIGALCSIVTWSFTTQTEAALGQEKLLDEEGAGRDAAGGNFLLDPSPELMLLSCLVFGCCVSSFAHRRQDQDTFQFAVYAAFIIGAVVSGVGFNASANLILLGYIPWAMCVAMAASLYGHALHRWQRCRAGKRSGDEEKALLVRFK